NMAEYAALFRPTSYRNQTLADVIHCRGKTARSHVSSWLTLLRFRRCGERRGGEHDRYHRQPPRRARLRSFTDAGRLGRTQSKQKNCMMSDTVWISLALGSSTNLRPLRHPFSETDQRQDGIGWGDQNIAGEPLKAECFPSEIY